MPRYNLWEYSDDHANAQGSLHQYARNKPNIGDDAAMASLNWNSQNFVM